MAQEVILQRHLLTLSLICTQGKVSMWILGMSKVGLQGRQFSSKVSLSMTRKKCYLSCSKQCMKTLTKWARNLTSSTKTVKLNLMLFWLLSSGTDSNKEISQFLLICFTDNWNQKCSVPSVNLSQSRLTRIMCSACRFPNNLYSQVLP